MVDGPDRVPVVEAGDAAIPAIGLGTWQHTGAPCAETVRTALELGYRHVDTARAYDNEGAVGRGLSEADVDREAVFLTTKLWRSDLRAAAVVEATHESIEALDVEYVDLLLIHWPHPRVPLGETLGAMAELRDDGLVRHLGVANFTRDQLERARRLADVPLVTDQVLYNPYKDQSDLLEYLAGRDLTLTAYSPLARGGLLGDDTLADVGERYGKTPAQVALRWLVQQPGVVAIPKATGREHLEENLDVFDFELTDAEMERVAKLRPGLRDRLYTLGPAIVRRVPF
ncbi:MAG: aldo/keto reductase [Halobacteriales archaeon]